MSRAGGLARILLVVGILLVLAALLLALLKVTFALIFFFFRLALFLGFALIVVAVFLQLFGPARRR